MKDKTKQPSKQTTSESTAKKDKSNAANLSKTQRQGQELKKSIGGADDSDVNEGEENFHPDGARMENPMEQ